MTRRLAAWSVAALLALLIAGDGLLLVRFRGAQRRLVDAEGVPRPGAPMGALPELGGYSSTGARVWMQPDPRSCWVVRYEARDCEYCRFGDRRAWPVFATGLRRLGCATAILLPTSGEALRFSAEVFPAGTPQVAFVNMDWIQRFRLEVTPTTMVFGPHRRLIWYRIGMLAPGDRRAAESRIRAARPRRE